MSRKSSGRPLLDQTRSRPAKRKTPRRNGLSALELAEHEYPSKVKVRTTRLGEIEDDGEEGGDRAKKRRKTTAEDGFDSASGGSDSEGEKWHVGVGSDDDDSDLDSDAAMGASDEERFEGFAFRGSTARKKRKVPEKPKHQRPEPSESNIDLSEGESAELGSGLGEEEDDDDFGEEGVDLATALDMNEEEERHQQANELSKQRSRGQYSQPKVDDDHAKASSVMDRKSRFDEDNVDEEETGEEDEDAEDDGDDDDDGDEEDSFLSFSDEENGVSVDTSRLRGFVEGLGRQEITEEKVRTRDFSHALGKPSEFGLKSSKKLTIADLLPTVTDPSLRQSLKMLHNSSKADPKTSGKGIPGKLEPPLAKRQQDRLDRTAAYEKSKETLNRWIDTVKQNRRAEHISFPLHDTKSMSVLGTKELVPASQSIPLTSLESAIQNIMQESGIVASNGDTGEAGIQAFEQLQERKMPLEEVLARRAELRKSRELMFREEIRARRIKKIKSKSYRRVHRKERDKLAQEERAAMAAAGILDSEEEREQNDRRRAEERMGARHRESRWAKGVKASGRAAWDADARDGVSSLARKDEELRRRIEGKKVTNSEGSESEDSSSESEDEVNSVGSDTEIRRKLASQLDRLTGGDDTSQPWSNLGSMAFMQRADASRKAANDAEAEQLRRFLSGDESRPELEPQLERVGRMKFGAKESVQANALPSLSNRNEFEERLSEDENEHSRKMRATSDEVEIIVEDSQLIPKKLLKAQPKSTGETARPGVKDQGSENPWTSKKANTKKGKAADEVSILNISNKATTKNSSPAEVGKRSQPSGKSSEQTADFGFSSESEEEGASIPAGATRNQELAKMAFAGDDVFEAFDREKQETMEEEGDQFVDSTLPGWGNWTGNGISKREQKRGQGRFITRVEGVSKEQRKDSKLEQVIVNEKRVKKNSKYLASELPHPFESRQQYERSLRLPLGPEWTTKKTFQEGTKPRILLKQGIIRPLERPLA